MVPFESCHRSVLLMLHSRLGQLAAGRCLAAYQTSRPAAAAVGLPGGPVAAWRRGCLPTPPPELGRVGRHQTRDFREHAASAPAELGGEIHNVSRNRAVRRSFCRHGSCTFLRQWHVGCLLGRPAGRVVLSISFSTSRDAPRRTMEQAVGSWRTLARVALLLGGRPDHRGHASPCNASGDSLLF